MSEHDLYLKLRLGRVLWEMGYVPRIDVKLASPVRASRASKRSELTDIDVVGFRVHSDLSIDTVVADCKSGARVSPSVRAFYLRGVMDYFEASSAYLVVKKAMPLPVRAMGHRLGVRFVDEANLGQLEGSYPSARLLNVLTEDALTFVEEQLSAQKQLSDILEFRKYSYWIQEDFRNIHRGLGLLRRNKGRISVSNKWHRYIIVDLILLLSIVVIRMGHYVLGRDIGDTPGGVREFLFGGSASLEERVAIIEFLRDHVYPNLQDEARRSLRPEQLTLDPAYLNELVELVVRFVRRPVAAAQVPRYGMVVLSEHVLGSGQRARDVIGSGFSELALKLLADVANFVVNTTGLDPSILKLFSPDYEAPISGGTPERREIQGQLGFPEAAKDPAQSNRQHEGESESPARQT